MLLVLPVAGVPAARGRNEKDATITPEIRAWGDWAADQWARGVDIFDIAERLRCDRRYVGLAIRAFTEDWVAPCERVPCDHVPYQDDKPGEDRVRTMLALQRYRAAGNSILEPTPAPPSVSRNDDDLSLKFALGIVDRLQQRALQYGDFEGFAQNKWHPIKSEYSWELVPDPGRGAVELRRRFYPDERRLDFWLHFDEAPDAAAQDLPIRERAPALFPLVSVREGLLQEIISQALGRPPAAILLPSSSASNATLTLEDLLRAMKVEAAAEQAGPAEQPSSTAFVINETADSDAGQQKTDAVVRRL